MFPPTTELEKIFNKMFYISAIPTDSTWYASLGKELFFYPTHLVLPWNCEALSTPLKHNLP